MWIIWFVSIFPIGFLLFLFVISCNKYKINNFHIENSSYNTFLYYKQRIHIANDKQYIMFYTKYKFPFRENIKIV
jgi:hypothetical protein